MQSNFASIIVNRFLIDLASIWGPKWDEKSAKIVSLFDVIFNAILATFRRVFCYVFVSFVFLLTCHLLAQNHVFFVFVFLALAPLQEN